MTQGSQPAKDFICNVLVKAYRVYGVDAQSKLEPVQRMDVLSILLNGFNTTVKTVKTIAEVITYAQEAKPVKDKPTIETITFS